MTNERFKELVAEVFKRQQEIMDVKGPDYTVGNKDRLHNFKVVADLVGITPAQVWAVYWLKHVLAILARVSNHTESEPIEGRLADCSNYNILLEGLLADEDSHSP